MCSILNRVDEPHAAVPGDLHIVARRFYGCCHSLVDVGDGLDVAVVVDIRFGLVAQCEVDGQGCRSNPGKGHDDLDRRIVGPGPFEHDQTGRYVVLTAVCLHLASGKDKSPVLGEETVDHLQRLLLE